MRTLIERVFHSKRSRAGNIMLEFALASSLLVAAFAGTFEFGYTFYRYNSLQAAVNEGAFYASQRTYNSTTTTPPSAFLTAVKNMVVYGNPAGGTSPIAPGLTTSNVNLTVTFSNGVPGTMTVSISGYTIDAIFAKNTFTNKPKVTYPFSGIYSPF